MAQQKPIYLRPIEVIILRNRYASFLEPYQWDHLFKYSMLGYTLRGYRKYHNTMVRKLYRKILD